MFGYAPHSGISYSNPQGKAGTFEFADGGTIFLDEIGDFSTAMQAKLLRVLEDGCVQRVGSNDIIEVDVRVVAATNKDIRAMIDEGTFRADLYHRINCLQIALPPLRDRESDILLLAAHFLEQHVSPPLREKLHITHETARVLTSYPWPGNVRELRNAILRASLSATGAKLEPEHLLPEITGYLDEPGVIRTLIQVEKEHIQTVLRAANGNKRKAAELLDISPQTLYNKMKEYNVGVRDTTVG
jgi:transcriptional regulator with PAS, ATPase and Fis domain